MQWRRNLSWFSFAIALAACDPAIAQSQSPVIEPAGDLVGGATPERFLFFSGFDLYRFGYAGYGGLQWAPTSLDDEGFVLRVFLSDGIERFDTPATRYRTTILRASVLPGWHFKRGKLDVKVFAGPDFERDDYTPLMAYRPPSRTSFGARVAADLWWEPSPNTMLSASASATTIATGYSVRLAGGWRVNDVGWAGPEIAMSADRFSEQYRVGGHVTGLSIAGLEWSFAAGYVQDSFQRRGVYGRIGILARR